MTVGTGEIVGTGETEGCALVGLSDDGAGLGMYDGHGVGIIVGIGDGAYVGMSDGAGVAVGPGVGMVVGTGVGYGHVDEFTLHGPTPPAQSVAQSKLFVVENGSISWHVSCGGVVHQSLGSSPVSWLFCSWIDDSLSKSTNSEGIVPVRSLFWRLSVSRSFS